MAASCSVAFTYNVNYSNESSPNHKCRI